MNILYVNHYAGAPVLGMEFRPYHLAREWIRNGHRVLMVAAAYSHVRLRQPDVRGAAVDQVIDGITYRWLATPPYRGNGIGRAWNIACFLLRLWREAPRIAREFAPDVVIASSTYPMDVWATRRIAALAGAKLVFEVHDLWPLTLIEVGGMSSRHPFALLCRWAERTAYRASDLVVSMLPRVQPHVAAQGFDLRKLAIVPNGVDANSSELAQPVPPEIARALSAARSSGRTVVGYAGAMGRANALDTLLDAALRLRGRAIAIMLVGDGPERERLAGRVERETIDNVTFLPPIAKSQIPSFLCAIDIAYIGWQRVPIYRFGIAPNKLMDYMLAGRVVLHAVEAGNDPVTESGCGIAVQPEAPDAVADGLERLAALSEADRVAMGQRGRAFVLAHHTYPMLARRFVEAIERA